MNVFCLLLKTVIHQKPTLVREDLNSWLICTTEAQQCCTLKVSSVLILLCTATEFHDFWSKALDDNTFVMPTPAHEALPHPRP